MPHDELAQVISDDTFTPPPPKTLGAVSLEATGPNGQTIYKFAAVQHPDAPLTLDVRVLRTGTHDIHRITIEQRRRRENPVAANTAAVDRKMSRPGGEGV
jgi:hypothetical protein